MKIKTILDSQFSEYKIIQNGQIFKKMIDMMYILLLQMIFTNNKKKEKVKHKV